MILQNLGAADQPFRKSLLDLSGLFVSTPVVSNIDIVNKTNPTPKHPPQ